MFRFIHAADIHLDSPLKGLDRYEGAPVDECRSSTRRALENLVALAVAERVAFVLIVGDLYDGDWTDYSTGLYFSRRMAELRDAGIGVYLVRGNHDAANLMTRSLKLPENVRMLSTERAETVTLDDVGVALHGQGYPTRAVLDNLVKDYPKRVPGSFNIGLLHTGIDGREGHEPYAPCTLDDLRSREYDYWALGHIHRREILRGVDPFVAFPGNVQGRHARETGPKGCLLVTVDDARRVSVEPRWLDVLRWEVCRVDAVGAPDADDLLARFRDRLGGLLPGTDDRLLALRVEFHGGCPAHAGLAADWPGWSNEVRQLAIEAGSGRVWVEKVVSRTAPPSARPDSSDDGPRAELARVLAELGDDDRLKEWIDRELVDLRKRDSWLLEDLDSPARRRELLDQVGPLLARYLDGQASATH